MIHDLDKATSSLPADCDVCILGAGPAGIIAGLELARRRPDWHIVILEGGGLEPPSKKGLDPYRGESTGAKAYPLAGSRLRYLGGTSNHWGGWCRPLDPEDFAKRAWVPRSGWPVARKNLMPWYKKAATWCEVGSTEYDEDALSPGLGDSILPLGESSLLRHKYFRFSPPTRFGTRYRDDLDSTENLDVYLHANAIDLDWSGERVSGVHVASGNLRRLALKTDRLVVGLGGIESTRFLLTQVAAAPPGSGLASPMMGRCFADHFGRTPARVILSGDLNYRRRDDHPDGPIMPVIALRTEAQKSLQVPDFCMTLIPQPDPDGLTGDYGDNTALGFRPGEHWSYQVQLTMEPTPNPDSRITLTDEHDRFGVPRLRLAWRFRESDFVPSVDSLREVAAEFGALGLGRFKLFPEKRYNQGTPGIGYHHMGSLRMAESIEEGVVDASCRVHGIENLYVAGSAVYPAFGFSNPTLTIAALAVRLASHLAQSTAEAA